MVCEQILRITARAGPQPLCIQSVPHYLRCAAIYSAGIARAQFRGPRMVRSKPQLFLTLSNSTVRGGGGLITPPCYVAKLPPPIVTPVGGGDEDEEGCLDWEDGWGVW
jgi:hypothetical protein